MRSQSEYGRNGRFEIGRGSKRGEPDGECNGESWSSYSSMWNRSYEGLRDSVLEAREACGTSALRWIVEFGRTPESLIPSDGFFLEDNVDVVGRGCFFTHSRTESFLYEVVLFSPYLGGSDEYLVSG